MRSGRWLKPGRLGEETEARQPACRLRISCLGIEVSEYTGKGRTLNYTEALDLKARQFKSALESILVLALKRRVV